MRSEKIESLHIASQCQFTTFGKALWHYQLELIFYMPRKSAITCIRETANCLTFRNYLGRTCHVLNSLL